MTKRLFLLCFVILITSLLYAQEKISAYSRHVMDLYKKSTIENIQSRKQLNKLANIKTDGTTAKVETLIELNNDSELPLDILDKLNISVINTIGNIHIVNLPIENIQMLAEIESVKSVSIARKIRPLNDKARSTTKVDEAHIGTDLPQAYNGEGVVVGIVDIGIDYNHINFKDENGISRVKVAATYDTNKNATLVYHTPEEIATLTTDSSNDSHGTHVAGIATGSYSINNFHGMATGSDIVLYGLGNNMSTTNILNGVKTVFEYAESVNKPASVNISLGTNIGPHDGTDSFNKALDKLIGDGKIILIASGNEGNENLYINKTFSLSSTEKPQFSTILNASGTTYDCVIDTWSNKSQPIGIQFFIYNSLTQTEELTSDIFYPVSGSYKESTWTNATLSTYFKGSIISFGMKSSSNNRYEMYSYIDGKTTNSKYLIGVKYYGKQNTEVYSWTTGAVFDDMSNSDYTKGTPDGSYNDLGCGKNSITVGAYCSKTTFKTFNGNTYQYKGSVEGDIAYFSSYGTDYNGRNHPYITAPGFTLISSVNNYDYRTVTTNKALLVNIVSLPNDTRKYHWGDMSGTSMATPVVTGTVALWLQANPNLNTEDVKTIMLSSATNDSFTQSGNPIKWGVGKLNAQAGLIKILQNSAIHDILVPDNIVMIDKNPSNGNFSAYIHCNEEQILLSVFSMNGTLIYHDHATPCNGVIDINLNGKLADGFYILSLQGEKVNYKTRLIIKQL